MRKRIIPAATKQSNPVDEWLNLEALAAVEVTSEDPEHPIESALGPGNGTGWRATKPGLQTIRLHFDSPQRVKLIHLVFTEDRHQRTQEFVLRWSGANQCVREIVRQQYNFTLGSREVEDYAVDLPGVSTLELEIDPAKGSLDIFASLTELQVR
jgi:hypothetical protein